MAKREASVIISEVRLSDNPDTAVIDAKEGINGKLNETKDGRKFCIIVLKSNDFLSTTTRNITYQADEDGNWKGMTPKELMANIGSEYPGARVVTQNVKAYAIGNTVVHTYSTIKLPKENIYTLFKAAGREILEEEFVDENTGEVLRASRQPA